MRTIDPGHRYALQNLKGAGETEIHFYKDAEIHGSGHAGPSCQEYHRALIDRVQCLDREKPWWGNELIVQKNREIIALFEVRALLLKASRIGSHVEDLAVGEDGHLLLDLTATSSAA